MKKKLEILNEGVVDVYLLFKFLKRLVTPFKNWKAHELGVIDKDGNIIKPKSERSSEENKSLTKFDLMVLKLKRLLGKLPFGKSRLASYAAALWFLKEGKYQQHKSENFLIESYTNFYNDLTLNPIYMKEYVEMKLLFENIDKKKFTKDDAIRIGKKLNVDFSKVDVEEFRMGLEVELEHDDDIDPKLDVVNSIEDVAKIALAHLRENPKYYTELEKSGIDEEVPVNNIGSGNIAVYDPVLTKKRKKRKTLKDFIK